jgi:hypothetical protein
MRMRSVGHLGGHVAMVVAFIIVGAITFGLF